MTHIQAHPPWSTCRVPGEIQSAFEAFVLNPPSDFCTSPFLQLGELCLSDPPTVPLLTSEGPALGAALASWAQGSAWFSHHRHTASHRSGNDPESQVRWDSPRASRSLRWRSGDVCLSFLAAAEASGFASAS